MIGGRTQFRLDSSRGRGRLGPFRLSASVGPVVLFAVLLAGPARAAIFAVNSVGDAGDAAPGNGACATAGAVCTLRAAIQEANALAGTDTINFNILPAGAYTIAPGSALPPITTRVTIDGTTQPGFLGAPLFAPVIQLNAAGTGGTGLLLDVGSSGSIIRGLCINRTGAAIRITGSSNNVIAGNFLGTNTAGTGPGPAPLNQVGVFVGFLGTTNGNRIGGTVAADRNVISGNSVDGIQIFVGGGVATANNLVQGNYIGLDVNGMADVGNSNQGVSIFGSADNNTVGGILAGAGNVISGNNNDGILIADAGTTGNIVQGNRIGTNAAGTAAVANLRGIELTNSASSTIGGAGVARNQISGNLAGITINNSDNNTVQNNLIGTNFSGTLDLGNLQHGVELIAGASGNVIGGAAGLGNVISGNDQYGVNLIGAGTSTNRVVGNIIGLDLNGDADLGNTQMGVGLGQGATDNIIGEAGNRNVISGNNQSGVFLVDAGTSTNRVQNNFIGLDIMGALARPNGNDGVRLDAGGAATGNIIGGTVAGLGNVISGNLESGIRVINQMASTLIAGNLVGTNAAGTAGIGNRSGVTLEGPTSNNTIGGTVAAAANVIAYNNPGNLAGNGGIVLGSPGGAGNSILGNAIHSNGGLGIDLGANGVTGNDAGDPDPGPNELLNFPLITSAFVSGPNMTVNYKLDLAAGDYRIEFFRNPSGADTTPPLLGYGEGEVFATSANVNHVGGALFYNVIIPGSAGEIITATTTKCTNAGCAILPSPPNPPSFGSTSEFAKAMTAVPTAVELMSFTANGQDGAMDLSWQTGSELGNLGFHLYRSRSVAGAYERITSAVVPGLGWSPVGASYSYRDTGLTNGVVYHYKLEDIGTTGATKLHGPVSAVPARDDAGDGSGGDGSDSKRVAYGDPSAVSLRVLERDAQHVLLELETGGFFATPNDDGSFDLSIPSFEDDARPGQPKVPTRRAWTSAVAGRRARITSIQAEDTVSFPDLRPAPTAAPVIEMMRDGTLRPGRSRRPEDASFRRSPFPRISARIRGTAFQGETKKVELELAPLRYVPASNRLVLSRRLLVRVDFAGSETGETSLGGFRGRRPPPLPRLRSPRNPLVQLVVRDRGLYRVLFEEAFPGRRAAILLPSLSLSRKGAPVAFFVDRASFGPGSSLYFLSEGASLNPESEEVVYELAARTGGLRMSVASAAPSGAATSFHWQRLHLEQNKTYQSGLLDAPDPWLWQVLVSPVTKAYPFSVDRVAATSAPSRLTVWLQGGSDFEADPDHHVRISVNGIPVGEASWDGTSPKTIEADLTPGVLVEGTNTLEVENAGDAGAAYSMVFLDKFALVYPRATSAVAGVLEGIFTESGTVEVAGLGRDTILLDTTETTPRWLTGATAGPGSTSFRVEAGHRYFAADPSALKTPSLRFPASHTLESKQNQADYLLIGPRDFLPAAAPLLALRRAQGLRAKAVAMEDVATGFGFGEEGPGALKSFLAHAYHSWKRPSPRYVVLLGDATYDPKDYLHTGVKNRVPPLLARTTYLWTASDPSYAALNGDDLLPDLALGRLPAQTVDEARILVEKIVAFETAGRDLSGRAVLVADNPDEAGDFEADADDLAATVLAGRDTLKLFLSEKGGSTRAEIAQALDAGASLLSYVGHGSTAVWASENVWNNVDVDTLQPQPQQPVLFTMNCLNGLFHFPPMNALAEQFVKAEGKGAIAAVSPSGLSLDVPAHVLHQALLAEVVSGRHQRLGDAFLAAQGSYADSGAFPELLSIYHLFGDPALKIR